MSKQRKPARHNPMARALSNPLFRKRVVRDRKKEARAGYRKHRGEPDNLRLSRA